MSRILIIGGGAMSLADGATAAPLGDRVSQLAKCLSGSGDSLLVLVPQSGGWPGKGAGNTIRREDIICRFISPEREIASGCIRREAERFKANAVLSVGLLGGFLVASSRIDLPFWADLDGDPLLEALGEIGGGDRLLCERWRMLKRILSRADFLSASSTAQRYMLIGELATQGRLCKENAGVDLVQCIPPLAAGGTAGITAEAAPLTRWARDPRRSDSSVSMAELTVLPELLDRDDIAARLDELRVLKRSILLRVLLRCAGIRSFFSGAHS